MISKRTALVLASSSGLGLASAKALYQDGHNIIMTSHSPKIFDAQRGLEALGGSSEILALQKDVTNLKDLDSLIDQSLDRFPSIDILFTNGPGPQPGGIEDLEVEDFKKAHEDLLLPVITLVKKLSPNMMEKKWGRIIMNTSITAKEPSTNLLLSNVYRAGLVALSKTLSKSLASYGVTVNTVAPAAFKTPRAVEILTNMASKQGCSIDEVERNNTRSLPMKRYNTPEEFGSVIGFLASDGSSGITGSMIAVDGGIASGLF